MNKIYEAGGQAITNSDFLVHASGHPGKEDLKILYEAFNPTDIVPIHGESHLLNAHKDFINESFPNIKAHVIYNFSSLLIDNNLEINTINNPPKEPLFIHGKEVVLEKEGLKQRRKLASSGCLFLSIKIESLGNKRANLKLEFFGLPKLIQDQEKEIKWLINNYLAKTKIKQFEKSKEELKIEIRRLCNKSLGYKPIVFIHFI
jgi:ribonuclease J